MLKFQQKIFDVLNKKGSGIIVTGKGMGAEEIVNQFVFQYLSERKLVVVFGCSDFDKYKITWHAANQGIENLPKDIEFDTGKKERSQCYSANNVYFHSPGILAKDFLQGLADPKSISGIIINHADTINKDPSLQTCIAFYKSYNQEGFIKAFSERPYDMLDLANTLDLLWLRYILVYPRFEESVKESISTCEIQVISISLKRRNEKKDDDFDPIICDDFGRAFEILQSLHKAFISEHGPQLNVSLLDSMIIPKKILEKKAITDKQIEVLHSIIFFQNAFFILLHDDPSAFLKFLESKRPSPYNQPLWASYPQVRPLFKAASTLASISIPNPKLQWIAKMLQKTPHDKKILILASRTSTVEMIARYLSSFVPKTSDDDIQSLHTLFEHENDNPSVDSTVFGIIPSSMVLLQEMNSQSDVFERFDPDIVILWDVTLLCIRRLEIFESHNQKKIDVYALSYTEAKEMDGMQNAAKKENEMFIQLIGQIRTLSPSPLVPFNITDRTIIVDDREFRSGMPYALLKVGFKVVPSMITVGDYVLSPEIAIERKAYTDLVQSLKSGRLFQQIQRMRQYYKRVMIMLEFSETDQYNVISSRESNSFVMSKICLIVYYFPSVRIIWGRNFNECGKTLMMLSKGEDLPDLDKAQAAGSSDSNSTDTKPKHKSFLSSIPFLNVSNITIIRERCKNLRGLLSKTRDEMIAMLGSSTGLRLFVLLHSSSKPSFHS